MIQLIPCIPADTPADKEGTAAINDAVSCFDNGADALYVLDRSCNDAAHDAAIAFLKEVTAAFPGPVYAAGGIHRFEDIKKILYAGCAAALLTPGDEHAAELYEEGCARFGADRVGFGISYGEDIPQERAEESPVVCYVHNETELAEDSFPSGITGIASGTFAGRNLFALREKLNASGIPLGSATSAVPFSEFKLNSDGLIPVIAQDHKTGEVLMLAYMNRESYELTLRTGKMTYFSRSRQALWTKGETSGHFQYVRSLALDCDGDTILAKVAQVGPACHTGNRSCFFRPLATRGKMARNPLEILTDVYGIIEDRKAHPKEGSYTNYLFDKGLDKILKKVGEENAEIIIAAKNPDASEIRYEISDYLYHLMVLMAEKGITWEDITEELARR